MSNQNIIKEFEKLVNQIEFDFSHASAKDKTTHQFRLKNIKNALKIIKKISWKIKSGKDLVNLPGIGKGTIARIDEILETGKLSEVKLTKSHKLYLKEIAELEAINGIGPKKAYDYIKIGITSVDKLIKAHENGIVDLPYKILIGLKYKDKVKHDIPRSEIDEINQLIQSNISSVDPKLFGILAGSYRREKATSGDIDVLITHSDIKTEKQLLNSKVNYLKDLVKSLKKSKFILDDLDPDFVRKYMGFCRLKNKPIRRIDIRYIPYQSYYSALLYFTGSGQFNQYMRQLAKRLGYKLSEYGLFKNVNGKWKRITISNEKDIFDELGMKYLKPSEREV